MNFLAGTNGSGNDVYEDAENLLKKACFLRRRLLVEDVHGGASPAPHYGRESKYGSHSNSFRTAIRSV